MVNIKHVNLLILQHRCTWYSIYSTKHRF